MSLQKRAGRAGVGPMVGRAATNTVNLLVAGGAGVAAAALHSLPVLALGTAAYLAMVAWDAMSPEFQRKVRSVDAPVADLQPLFLLDDPRCREFAQGLIRARQQRETALEEAPASAENFLAGSLSQVPGLEAHAVLLIERLAGLRDHLAEDLSTEVRLEADDLERRAQRATDPETRAQLQAAAESKRGQRTTLGDLERTAERVEAHLTNILAVLEGVPAKLVHMRTLDDSNRDSFSSDVKGDLSRLDAELSAFEETLKPVAVRSR